MPVEINDFTEEVLAALNRQMEAGLEAVGQQAVSHAKQNISKAGRIASGTMMNSIESRVQMGEKAVYIGTNNEYAPYHEVGTGIYADSGSGRKTKWRYKDANGNWHTTNGIRPIHFLKSAAAEHQSEYGAIIKEYLEK
jgi:phage gpG-like protein